MKHRDSFSSSPFTNKTVILLTICFLLLMGFSFWKTHQKMSVLQTNVVNDSNSTAGYEVQLRSTNPLVYKSGDIPVNPGNVGTFAQAQWISGSSHNGAFVVSGRCNNASMGNTTTGEFEAGGQYTFDANGKLIGINNVCFDTATVSEACDERGGCFVGSTIIPLGNGKFIREGEGGGRNRSPVLYQVGDSAVTKLGTLFYNTGWNSTGDDVAVDSMYKFEKSIIANNILVGVGSYNAGNNFIKVKNSFYDVSAVPENGTLRSLKTASKPSTLGAYKELPLFYPITGAGNYFFATDELDNNPSRFLPVKLYKMPSASELQSGNTPQAISMQFPTGRIVSYAWDAKNPGRIAVLFWRASFQNKNLAPLLVTYQDCSSSQSNGCNGSTGFVKMSEREAPFLATPYLQQKSTFALSGEYFSYLSCAMLSDKVTPNIKRSVCSIVVEKNGQRVSVEPLPLDASGTYQSIYGVSLSSSNTLLAIGGHFTEADKDKIYAYTLEATTNPTNNSNNNTQRSGDRNSNSQINSESNPTDNETAVKSSTSSGDSNITMPSTAPRAPEKFPDGRKVGQTINTQMPRYVSSSHKETGVKYMSVESSSRLIMVKVLPDNTYTYRTGFYQTKENTWMPFRFAGKTNGSWISGKAEAGILLSSVPANGNIIAYICEKKGDEWFCGFEKMDGRNAGPWTFESYTLNRETNSKENQDSSSRNNNSTSKENEITPKTGERSYEPFSCDTCNVIGATECAVNLRSSFIGTDFLGTHMRVCKLVDGCRKWVVQECSRRVCMNKQCR